MGKLYNVFCVNSFYSMGEIALRGMSNKYQFLITKDQEVYEFI